MITSGNDYAVALFILASENGKLDEFAKELGIIKDVFKENPDYALLLGSPNIPKKERMSVIDTAFKDKLSEYAVNFIKVLCEHGKIGLLDDTVKEFLSLKKAAENSVAAYVYTAVPLDEKQTETLKVKLEKQLSCQIIIKSVIDENIIGGIKIELDGKVIDGSIKRQLHDIKEVISK